MSNELPRSIELSSLQKQSLQVIVSEGDNIGYQPWPERAILLWAEGLSAPQTAHELDTDENSVSRVRELWLSSTSKLRSAEKSVHDAIVALIAQITAILNSDRHTKEEKPRSTPKRGVRGDAENPAHARPTVNDLIEMVHNSPRTYNIHRPGFPR